MFHKKALTGRPTALNPLKMNPLYVAASRI